MWSGDGCRGDAEVMKKVGDSESEARLSSPSSPVGVSSAGLLHGLMYRSCVCIHYICTYNTVTFAGENLHDLEKIISQENFVNCVIFPFTHKNCQKNVHQTHTLPGAETISRHSLLLLGGTPDHVTSLPLHLRRCL